LIFLDFFRFFYHSGEFNEFVAANTGSTSRDFPLHYKDKPPVGTHYKDFPLHYKDSI